MLMARRALSVPLFVAGGLLLLVGYGGGFAAGIYYEVLSFKMIFFDGRIVEGILVGTVVMMIVVTIINLLNFPGAAFLEGASRLWGEKEPTAAGSAFDDYEPAPYSAVSPHDYADADEPTPFSAAPSRDYAAAHADEFSFADTATDYGYGHVRDKPHTCPHCSKRLTTLNGLSQHIASKHAAA